MVKPFHVPDYAAEPTVQPAPVEILREAARALSAGTHGQVEGSVFTGSLGGVGSYRHTFYLRAVALNDYTDPLFYVWHGPELYPAHCVLAGKPQQESEPCRTPEELHDWIQRLLDADVARQRIRALLAQVDNRSGRGSL
jgi:hypothetical protein